MSEKLATLVNLWLYSCADTDITSSCMMDVRQNVQRATVAANMMKKPHMWKAIDRYFKSKKTENNDMVLCLSGGWDCITCVCSLAGSHKQRCVACGWPSGPWSASCRSETPPPSRSLPVGGVWGRSETPSSTDVVEAGLAHAPLEGGQWTHWWITSTAGFKGEVYLLLVDPRDSCNDDKRQNLSVGTVLFMCSCACSCARSLLAVCWGLHYLRYSKPSVQV